MPNVLHELERWNAHVHYLQHRYLMLYPATRPLSQEEVLLCIVLLQQCRRSGQDFTLTLRDYFIPTTRNA